MIRQGPARPLTAAQWERFDTCHICAARPGRACLNLKAEGELLTRAHPERVLAVDRDGAGVMVLSRREHVTSSRPGTTHGAYAHHASIGGVTVCGDALVAEKTAQPITALYPAQRCQRASCKRLWTFEELR